MYKILVITQTMRKSQTSVVEYGELQVNSANKAVMKLNEQLERDKELKYDQPRVIKVVPLW